MAGKIKRGIAFFLTAAMLLSPLSGADSTQAAKRRLNRKKATIRVGQSVRLKLKHAKGKVKWSSKRKAVAKVNRKGKVTGRKPGTTTIVAKCKGKKYTCKVKVLARKEGEQAQQTSAPTASPTAEPQTSNPPNFPNGASTQSSAVKPAACAEDTMGVGNLSVTLGMTAAEVEAKLGGKPDRVDVSSMGYNSYIYNPSLDYTNYVQIQFDQDKVVCISTISNYFRYENILSAGEDTEMSLTQKGFSSMGAKFDYDAGYYLETDKEYITAFVDHQGSGTVYAAEIFSKKTSAKDNATLEELARAESGTYNSTNMESNAKELFDWACAFRAVKGLKIFTPVTNSKSAQTYSEANVEGTADANITVPERFEANYGPYRGCSQVVSYRHLDAFGALVWLIDNKSSGAYPKLTLTADTDGTPISNYYLCTGFASKSTYSNVTFVCLDLFYF